MARHSWGADEQSYRRQDELAGTRQTAQGDDGRAWATAAGLSRLRVQGDEHQSRRRPYLSTVRLRRVLHGRRADSAGCAGAATREATGEQGQVRTYTASGELTEAALQAGIVRAARQLGWLVYHPWSSINSAAGYPDLTMVKGKRIVWCEVKSSKGRLSAAQVEWLDALRQAGAEAYVVKPADYDSFLMILAS